MKAERRRCVSWLGPACMALALWAGAAPAETSIGVAANGRDDAAGTVQAPFATVQRARDEVRRLKARGPLPTGGVRIVLRGGVYRLDAPLVIAAEDSGTAEAPVIWSAYPGERPVLSGGRLIAGLAPQADGSWSTHVAAARDHGWVFRQLFVDGRRYTGISLGWTWDTVRSGTRENLVEYNHVHDVMRVLDDGGGIYSLGLTPGSVIRNNLVHHVGTPGDDVGHGIYLDGGSAGVLCENNVCHDCGSGGIRVQHATASLTVLNNISAFCGFGLGIDSERTNIFEYNIVVLDGDATPFRYVPEWQSYNKIIDYNLYWHAQGKPIRFLDFSFDEWQRKEGIKDIWYTPRMDAHSRPDAGPAATHARLTTAVGSSRKTRPALANHTRPRPATGTRGRSSAPTRPGQAETASTDVDDREV